MLVGDAGIYEIQGHPERVWSDSFFHTKVAHQGGCRINTQVDCIKTTL